MERRLVAILAADVAGYSKRMEAAEESTADALARCQAAIAAAAGRLGGRVFSTAGDSALAEFSSPVNAVRCGVEIQRETGAAGDDPLALRIGVHLADVIVAGDDLIGDGVNIAARIQQAADPASVYVSQPVFEQVRRNSPFTFDDLGTRSLKNISEPIRLYRVSGNISRHPYQTGHAVARPESPTIRHGSLAVLPFEVAGGDEDQHYLADGFAEDLIVELSRFKGLFVSARSASASYGGNEVDPQVIGRELGVRHVLMGRLRRIGDRVRISVRLVDTGDGGNVWAETYARPWSEIFDLLDDLVARIAATIVGQVEAAGITAARRKRPQDLSAYDCLLRGLEHHRLGGVTDDNLREAVKWFDRAIELDPDYSLAYAWRVCSSSQLPDFDVDRGFAYVRKAIELDENNAEAHRIMASWQTALGDFRAAEHHIGRAMALNPSNAYIRSRSAAFYIFDHQPARALDLIAEAEALDPFLPVWCLEEKGVALYNLGRYDEAAAAFGSLAFQTYRSCCYAAAAAMAAGDPDRARKAIVDARAIAPALTVSRFLEREYYRLPEDSARLRDLVLAAGLPEGEPPGDDGK